MTVSVTSVKSSAGILFHLGHISKVRRKYHLRRGSTVPCYNSFIIIQFILDRQKQGTDSSTVVFIINIIDYVVGNQEKLSKWDNVLHWENMRGKDFVGRLPPPQPPNVLHNLFVQPALKHFLLHRPTHYGGIKMDLKIWKFWFIFSFANMRDAHESYISSAVCWLIFRC